MIVAETIFVNQRPVGMLRQDLNSGQIGFSPLKGESPLPDRTWDSMDQLKLAVTAAYSETTHDEGRDN